MSRSRLVRRFVLTPSLLVLSLVRAEAHHASAKLTVHDAWIRESLPGQAATSAYFTLRNPDHEADFLLGVDCKLAGVTELHRTSLAGNRMKMEKLEQIEIPARGQVQLAPDGAHLMLLQLKRPLKAGERVHLRLRFRFAEPAEVDVPVRPSVGADRAPR